VLGTADLRGAGGVDFDALLGQPKPLALLAYLALATPRGFHRRDHVLGLLWPGLDQDHARGALRKTVHLLRRGLGEGLLTRGDEELGLDSGVFWCDAVAFEQAAEAGRLARALELYRGDLLASFFVRDAGGFEQWLEQERTRLRALAAGSAWRLAEWLETEAQPTAATKWARRAMELTPFDERVLRKVLAMLDRQGDRAGAVAVYDYFRRQLAAEYGVDPSPETSLLIESIRTRRQPRDSVP